MRRFHDAVMQLSRMAGRDFEQTIKAEMGAVLTNAQRNTVKASVSSIKNRVRNQAFAQLDIGKGRKTYFLGNRMPDEMWRRVVAHQNRKEQKRLKARGLASRMWVHIADAIGVEIKNVPAYVRRAESGKGGDQRQKVDVVTSGSGPRYALGFINSLTDTNVGARAGLAFSRALTARANFFTQSVKLQAKSVIRSVLERYPGLGRVS